VIIVSWNVKQLLDACLLSLREELRLSDVHADVWIVDNASTDGSIKMIQERHPWVHLITNRENLGYVCANNQVLKQLQRQGIPDIIWLLNPDTIVQPGALRTLLRFFQTHPRAGLIGPQLLNVDGTLQPGAFRFPDLLQPFFDLGKLPQRFYYTRWNGRYPASTYESGQPFKIDHPLGAAMMARGEAIQDVGLLDEGFFMYCEEIDWAWRMKKAGWETWMVPEAKITHYGGASSGQARPATTAYLWESRARLYRKHRDSFTRFLVGLLVRSHFAHKPSEAPEWQHAYRKIVSAWQI